MARSLIELDAPEGQSESVLRALGDLGIDSAEKLAPRALEARDRVNLERHLGVQFSRPTLENLLAEAPLAGAAKRVGLGALIPAGHGVGLIPAGAGAGLGGTPMPFPSTPGLPSHVDLSAGFMPVRDQGKDRFTCVAFSVAAAAEYLQKRAPTDPHFCVEHLYWACKQADVAPWKALCGTFVQTGTSELPNGLADESAWSYDARLDPCPDDHAPCPAGVTRSPVRARGTALANGDLLAIKSALAKGSPVVASLLVFSWWTKSPDYDSGTMTSPTPFDLSKEAHALCVVGYEDAADGSGDGFLLIRNSWGTSFGATGWKRGYGKLPYRYVLGYTGTGPFTVELASIA